MSDGGSVLTFIQLGFAVVTGGLITCLAFMAAIWFVDLVRRANIRRSTFGRGPMRQVPVRVQVHEDRVASERRRHNE